MKKLLSILIISIFYVAVGCTQKPEFGATGTVHLNPVTRAGTFPTGGFEHAKEVQENEVIEDETLGNIKTYTFQGKIAIASTGGPLVGSADNKIPWDQPKANERSIYIPQGARIKTALLYYTGPMAREGGDFTPEDGLNTDEDVLNNTITFQINGNPYGPFDPNTKQPDKNLQSEVGSLSRVTRGTKLTFGTLTGVHGSVWSNRIDIKGLLENQFGNVKIKVNPPLKIDTSGNNATQNGGNPASGDLNGNTSNHNLCFSLTNWSIFVVYEHDDLEEKTVILKDGIILAWDYHFIHKGEWRRPKVTFNHGLVDPTDVNVYLFGTGSKAGSNLPTPSTLDQVCSCGCGGGFYLLPGPDAKNPWKFPVADRYLDSVNTFWSDIHTDPANVVGDYMHRDTNNGPWYTKRNGTSMLGGQPINGNDWTRFQSGNLYTDFPNLFEGEITQADSLIPVTNENWPTMDKPTAGNVFGYTSAEKYEGHPWGNSGDVEYLGWGNATNIIKVKLKSNRVDPAATQSTLYFKADQKDVFKPQANLIINFLAMEIKSAGPVNMPPVIAVTNVSENDTLTGLYDVSINVQDDNGVAQVECFFDGQSIGIDTEAPYHCQVNMANYYNGVHIFSVKATDNEGKSSILVLPVKGGDKPDTTAPQISLTAPLDGSQYSLNAPITFSATASDDVALQKVEFYVGASKIGEDTSAPYTASWTATQSGTYAIYAKAIDNAGNSSQSSSVSIVVLEKPACQEWTATNQAHVSAGRAETYYYGVYARTIGSGEDLGFYYSDSSTIKETNSGYYEKGTCSTVTPTKVEKPVFSPLAGTYTSSQQVTITSATSGVTIYYTQDGSTPGTSSPVYSGAITVSSTKTIKAMAVKSGYTNSDVSTATFTIAPVTGCQAWTATNYQHVAAGRAETYTSWYTTYARTKGGKQDLGMYGSSYYSTTTTVKETSPGYFEKGSCN